MSANTSFFLERLHENTFCLRKSLLFHQQNPFSHLCLFLVLFSTVYSIKHVPWLPLKCIHLRFRIRMAASKERYWCNTYSHFKRKQTAVNLRTQWKILMNTQEFSICLSSNKTQNILIPQYFSGNLRYPQPQSTQ